jgi:hypothetical protein
MHWLNLMGGYRSTPAEGRTPISKSIMSPPDDENKQQY